MCDILTFFFKPETELVVAWLRWSLHPLLVYRPRDLYESDFVLIRVGYLSSSEAYTNNWGLFGKENYFAFDW
jgi:hypothetical protein